LGFIKKTTPLWPGRPRDVSFCELACQFISMHALKLNIIISFGYAMVSTQQKGQMEHVSSATDGTCTLHNT